MSPNEPTDDRDAYSDPLDGIEVLHGNEHIRRRPAMYIGGTNSKGLHLLIFELLSNSLNAFTTSSRHIILVALLKDGGCKVIDDGSGFPVNPQSEQGKRVFEMLCTEPGYREPQPPCRSGLFGTGLKAVNALSHRMIVEVDNHGKTWHQEFQRGHARSPVAAIRTTAHTGTSITFWPDPEIFPLGPDCSFSWDVLRARLRELAAFYPSVKFGLIADRDGVRQEDVFHFPGGVQDYVRFLNRGAEIVHPHLFHFVDSEDGHQLEIALQWTNSVEDQTRTYCNTHFTVLGGSHQVGFRAGLTATLTQLLREHSRQARRRQQDTGDHYRYGLTAVIAVTVREPCFDSQDKKRLNVPEIEPFVQQSFARHFRAFLQAHPTDAAAIVAKLQSNLSVP